MPEFHLRYLLLALLAIALLTAAATDLRRREIDNWLTAAIALTAPLWWWASGLALWPDVAWQLGVAAISFAALTGLFAIGAMGGGDVKLLTALALWIAPLWFVRLVVVMSLLGGVLTLAMAGWYAARRRREKLEVPYGLAISAAGLWTIAAQAGGGALAPFLPNLAG